MDKPTCSTCPYWEEMPSKNNGDCRKGLPSIDISYSHTRWPISKPDEFCGEHPDFPAYLESLNTQQQKTTIEKFWRCKSCLRVFAGTSKHDGYCDYCYHPGGRGALHTDGIDD